MNSASIRLPPLPTIRDILKLYKITALKRLSQNFLLNERITDKIVSSVGKINNSVVFEVGPGPGNITRSIIKKNPKQVTVIEKDSRFLPSLELLKEASQHVVNLNIVLGDIKTFNFESSLEEVNPSNWFEAPPKICIIGNLPFNVSTILIVKWLQAISERNSVWKFGRVPMTLTFQKEVAERIVACNNDKQRCRLSVISQMWCDVEYNFTIKGTAFVPKPDVDVGVVTFKPLKYPLINLPFSVVEKVLRNIFNMRQKYSIRGAERLFPEEDRTELGLRMYYLADLNKEIRPTQITNEEFVRLCYAYKTICDEYPGLEFYDSRGPKINNQINKNLVF